MPSAMHRRPPRAAARRAACSTPAPCRASIASSRTARACVFRPEKGERLSARANPAARDLVRHAFADVGGNANRARSWARAVRHWPDAQPTCWTSTG